MSGTKEADLVTAVLLYAIRCIAEGDQHALRSMNFGPKEIDALRELAVEDLYRVDTLQVHCLRIALNRHGVAPSDYLGLGRSANGRFDHPLPTVAGVLPGAGRASAGVA